MEAKAHLKYARISPRKVKIVLDLIRGKDAGVAMAILKNTPKSASEYLVNCWEVRLQMRKTISTWTLLSCMSASASFAPGRLSRESCPEQKAVPTES